MAGVDESIASLVDGGAAIPAARGDVGERRAGIDDRERGAGGGDVRRGFGHGRDLAAEQLGLARCERLLGGDHLALELGELGGDVALAGRDGLLADVMARHLREVCLGDLDVVAEHAVVADLEVRDAAALLLARLDREDLVLAAIGEPAAFVDGRIVSRANDAAVAHRRRIIDERRTEPRRERRRTSPACSRGSSGAGGSVAPGIAVRRAEPTSTGSCGSASRRRRVTRRGDATLPLPASRSRSAIRESARRIVSVSVGRSTSHATASCRRRMCATSTSG
jgi:hypothetical protein